MSARVARPAAHNHDHFPCFPCFVLRASTYPRTWWLSVSSSQYVASMRRKAFLGRLQISKCFKQECEREKSKSSQGMRATIVDIGEDQPVPSPRAGRKHIITSYYNLLCVLHARLPHRPKQTHTAKLLPTQRTQVTDWWGAHLTECLPE